MNTIRFGRDERGRDELLGRVASLPTDLPPSRDLWPGIRSRLEATGQDAGPASRGLSWRWALAAGVAVASVSVLFTRMALRAPGDGETRVASGQPAPATDVRPVSYDNYARLGPAYAETRAQMLALFRARLATLPPETRQRVEQDLAVIQKAATDIDAALAKDPSSGLLSNLLLSTYQEEMRLYTSVATPL